MNTRIFTLFFFLLHAFVPAAPPVRINEVMASNGSTLADEDGDFADWIELHNTGEDPVDLSGWGLSDSYGNPFKWTFPVGTVLEGGGHLLVWASGQDRIFWPNAGKWPFSEVVDQKTPEVFQNENTGELLGAVSPAESAEVNGALDFAPSGRVNLREPLVLENDFSVAYWFFSRRNNNWRVLNSSENFDFSLGHRNPNTISLWAPQVDVPLSESFLANTWEHLLVTRSGSTVTVYRNGDQVGAAEWTGRLRLDQFGGTSGNSSWSGYNGMLGEVLALPYALTGQEIAALLEGKLSPRDVPLHTNFSISSSGEEIILTSLGGIRVDELPPTLIPRDISIGRLPDGDGSWVYFDTPTPGEPNSPLGYVGIADPPTFSHGSGMFENLASVSIQTPLGSTVLYSLDGSVPEPDTLASASPHRLSHPYEDPIALEEHLNRENLFSEIPTNRFTPGWLPGWQPPEGDVFKAVVVRARAFKEGHLPSDVVTATFLIGQNIGDRFGGLPVISLVGDYKDLFDPETGIYVPGATPQNNLDQNFFKGWNREVHLSLLEPCGTLGFEGGFRIRIQGNTSPASPLKGLHVLPRAWLGGSTLEYPLFAGRDGRASEAEVFERFVIRGWGSALNWPVFFSDAYHQQLAANTGQDLQGYRPAVVFINGEYWGLQEIREYNRSLTHLRERHGLPPDVGVDVIRQSGATLGDMTEWRAFLNYVTNHDLSDPVHYAHVQSMMDVENFIDYITHCTYTGKRDWPRQNEARWRPRVEGARWRWLQYDMDHGLGWPSSVPERSMIHQVVLGEISSLGPHPVLVALLANEEFKEQFVTRYADWMNSHLSLRRELELFAEMSAELEPHVAEHLARWPYGHDWEEGQAIALDIMERRAHLRPLQLQETLGLGNLRSLELRADPLLGTLRVNSLHLNHAHAGLEIGLDSPWTGNYYEDYPVRLTAVPRPGHRFAGWRSGDDLAIVSMDPQLEMTLTQDTALVAEFEPEPLSGQPFAIHAWDFEDAYAPLSSSYTLGGAALQFQPGSEDSQVVSNTGADFESRHLRVNFPLDSGLTFSLPTTGFEQISLEFLTRRSGQGAELMTLSITTDGSTWTEHSTLEVLNAPPQKFAFDFSGTTEVNNNPDFAVRFTFAQGEGGEAGNNRIDDVVFSGVAQPGTNLPPVTVGSLEAITPVAGATQNIDLGELFQDPNGDTLAFEVKSNAAGVLSVSVENGILTLEAHQAGEAVLTLSASDGMAPPTVVSTRLLVYPQPFPLEAGRYFFDHWSPLSPAGAFPPHMIFLQSEEDDTELETPLTRAYHIPAEDAARPGDTEFPYNAENRTRITGLETRALDSSTPDGEGTLAAHSSHWTREARGTSICAGRQAPSYPTAASTRSGCSTVPRPPTTGKIFSTTVWWCNTPATRGRATVS